MLSSKEPSSKLTIQFIIPNLAKQANLYLGLLIGDPALHNIRLPDELQEGGVVNEAGLAPIGLVVELLHLLIEGLAALADVLSIVVALSNQLVSLLGHLTTAVTVHLEVRLEGVMLLQQALDGGQGVTDVLSRQQMLLLSDPGFLLLHVSHELLVGEGLVQLLAAVSGHLLQLVPVGGKTLKQGNRW